MAVYCQILTVLKIIVKKITKSNLENKGFNYLKIILVNKIHLLFYSN